MNQTPKNPHKIDPIPLILEESVRKYVNYYGIEGYEEVLNRNYTHNPTVKAKLLAIFTRIYKKNT